MYREREREGERESKRERESNAMSSHHCREEHPLQRRPLVGQPPNFALRISVVVTGGHHLKPTPHRPVPTLTPARRRAIVDTHSPVL